MAFVFRNQADLNPLLQTPGPAYYRPQTQSRQHKLLSAPFNQTSNRKIWLQNVVPGPGSYNTQPQSEPSKMIVQTAGKTITLSTPVETSSFKSGSERFKTTKEAIPGPGKYLYDKPQQQKQKVVTQQSNLQKYLQATHQHKQVEDNQALCLKADEEESTNNQNQRESQYQPKSLKNSFPFNSSVQRNIKIRPKTSLGPGSYNCYVEKPRQQTNNRPNRNNVRLSLAKFKKVSPSEQGQWHPQQINMDLMFQSQKIHSSKSTFIKKRFNQRKQDFFGSTVSRFLNTQMTITPGPGNYQLTTQSTNKSINRKISTIAFGRESLPKSKAEIFINPQDYKPVHQRPKHKISSSKVNNHCSFGSSKPRFKSSKQNEPMFNMDEEIRIGKMKKRKQNLKLTSPKRHKPQERRIPKQTDIDSRPLCYASSANTIEAKIGSKEQKNAPFFSQVTRFSQIDRQMQVIQELLAHTHQPARKQFKRQPSPSPQPKGIMESKNPRFIYKQLADDISPCTYDPQKPSKKQQFNQLFL